MGDAVEHLKQVDAPLGFFYLGKALSNRHQYDEAVKAFDKAEKAGYSAPQVQLQRAGLHRHKGEIKEAKAIMNKLEELSKYKAEYNFKLTSIAQADIER